MFPVASLPSHAGVCIWHAAALCVFLFETEMITRADFRL